jgi:signal transduction histidine kinase
MTVEVHPCVEDLRTVDLLKDLSTDDLEWLCQRMELRTNKAGDVVNKAGTPAEHMIALFSGELRGERETGQIFVAHAGSITGLLPFSRLTHFPAAVRATKDTRGGLLHKDHFHEMLQRIPVLQERLVNLMADRIREATRADQQREKLMALGQLSAGLAHELNNPAAAGSRAASYLCKAVKDFRHANVKLSKLELSFEARKFLIQLESDLADRAVLLTLDSIERSEREETLAAWLGKQGIENAWNLAPDLVDAGCNLETLEQIAERIPKPSLSMAFARLTASVNITRLVDEIENSMKRITELVRAVKDYSYMDQMPEQEIDIHDGINTTLIMLKHRLKNGVEVVREYDSAIPRMTVRGSELNQVWTNLITNAIDAMNGKGKLRIVTKIFDGKVWVKIIDNGSGIPAEIKDRIFEPFFTTKGVNEGTGLGLDIAARVVKNHGGSIQVESQPGHTMFAVSLPVKLARHTAPRDAPPAEIYEDQAVRNSG